MTENYSTSQYGSSRQILKSCADLLTNSSDETLEPCSFDLTKGCIDRMVRITVLAQRWSYELAYSVTTKHEVT